MKGIFEISICIADYGPYKQLPTPIKSTTCRNDELPKALPIFSTGAYMDGAYKTRLCVYVGTRYLLMKIYFSFNSVLGETMSK